MEVLDNPNYITQHDPESALSIAAAEWQQVAEPLKLTGGHRHSDPIANVVVAGMGGSALAAGMAKDLLNLPVPFELARDYVLPGYVGPQTLVIASSYSGNTEETLSCLNVALQKGAQIAIISAGGQLEQIAANETALFVKLKPGMQPRMAVLANLQALLMIFTHHQLIDEALLKDFRSQAEWLRAVSASWGPGVSGRENVAKQLAWACAGKTPVIYASATFRSLAYKWKISMNENAKNVAFHNEYPEFNHNEFIGWTSHPVTKPYAIIDLVSSYDHPQMQKRFQVSDRLLSGQRPHSITVKLGGETVLQQMMWANVLSDFVSIYLALLNGVDPTPVGLVEKLKSELA